MEVVIPLIDKLSGIMVKEIAPVCNFNQHFEWLKKEFENINNYLESADTLPAEDKSSRRWLDPLRDAAWDAEDIVDECDVRRLNVSSVIHSCVCSPDELYFRYKMGKRIQDVKKRITSIIQSHTQLKGLCESLPRPAQQPSSSAMRGAVRKQNSLLPSDSHPVAIEPKVQHLISMIHEPTVRVIAVVAIGGAGKTFLLRNVFHRIEKCYKHSIWLSISQSYSVHKLQCDLASHMIDLKDTVKDVSEERAAELIHRRLQRTKSLIVLDDIWRCPEEDDIIKRIGLPVDPESQCKVLVSTRSKEVSQRLGALAYELELLSEQESWLLFCAYAFGGNLPPDHLKGIASQVEKQCGRLPLALKIIGASLSGSTEIGQWRSKLKQMEVVDSTKEQVMQILRLSYDSLSPHVKLCFSYLSFFPENELIDQEYLINLWIAEGFIPQSEDQKEQQWEHQFREACSYFDQLSNLCLLEVEENKHLVKHCKIHDLLLDLAIDISKENRCKFVVDDAIISAKRILLGKKEIDDKAIAQSGASCPRSLRTLSLYENPIQNIDEKFVSSIRLLRVLDLSKTKISTLPHCVGKLELLKFINLSSTEIKEVPICVRSLKSLLFLDLSDCKQLQSLPEWVSKLKCLQHLNIIGCNNELLSNMPKGISVLLALRVLRSNRLRLSVEEGGLLRLEDVSKLTRLQELSLEVYHETQLNSLEEGILAQLLKMRHLSIKSTLSSADSQPPDLSPMVDLHTLKLENFAVLNRVCALTDLTHLKLENCECRSYPELEKMPNLIKLTLDGNDSCREIPLAFGKSSGFLRLRFLAIQYFYQLEVLPDLENGAMAVLEEFYVGFCPRVKNVPEGLNWLTRLRKFYYTGKETDALNKGPGFWDSIKEKCPHASIIPSFLPPS